MKQILLIGLVMMATVVQATDELNYNFRSTSAMPGHNVNGHVSNVNAVKLPALDLHNMNAEVQEAAAAAVSEETTSGPRRVSPINPEGDPTPVGDGLWVLLLLALAYLINVRRRTLERMRE